MADVKSEISVRASKARDYLFEASNKIINPERPLRQAALHYAKSGGKGFRPAMIQICCGAVGGNEEDAIPAAAAVEAIHVSSLIHDDWMDNDETRRGAVAVWKKWDPVIAVLAGDVLVGLAFKIVGALNSISLDVKFHVATEIATKYTQLCHGQMLDIGFTTKPADSITVDDVVEMQYLKTGVLFEFCCVAGAMIGLNTLEHEYIEIMAKYAKLTGTAFQIQDDILGLIGNPNQLGKPVGNDIREGKRTLIAISAINKADEIQKRKIFQGFGNSSATKQEIEDVVDIFRELGAIEDAINRAKAMAKEALDLIEGLPDTEQKKILQDFALYMIERTM